MAILVQLTLTRVDPVKPLRRGKSSWTVRSALVDSNAIHDDAKPLLGR
jgi:hypothetical protein